MCFGRRCAQSIVSEVYPVNVRYGQVDCRYLSGKQRIMCLQRGLKDRDLSVAESATHMVLDAYHLSLR
jgi:hypothetical protein